MNTDKFLVFLESITTQENKVMVEAITDGYKAIIEAAYAEDFKARGTTNSPEEEVGKYIAILQRTAEKLGYEKAITTLDKMMGAYKEGRMMLAAVQFEKLPEILKNDNASKRLEAIFNDSYLSATA